ncbi:MFS transporter [Georgenia sp. TF02-10]|uniref:MFS transporter n=1 Tax=Georgenia sp. TF02-10 TaxID=2917725 RepID=UPI001FA7840C|nr:MFS transporter [Georgenia sp. TF02-10]UNX54566.1 MFS transporter [Georgenia sp. TF02-10]
MTSSPAGQAPDPARWRAFAVCLGAGFMTLLDVSIVNVALPSIEASLTAGPTALQWIVAGYTLAFGLALVPAGRVGDVLGRRGAFVAGLSAFVVTSAACGLAPSAGLLALTRLLQGFSAGVLNPQVVGFIQQLFRGPERGKAFGLFGATVGISTAIGPLLGGLLLAVFGEEEGWRAVFLVNVPVGAVLLPLALRYLPRHRPAGAPAGADAPVPTDDRAAALGTDRAAANTGRTTGPGTGRAAVGRTRRLDVDVVGLVLISISVLGILLPVITAAEGTGGAPWWLLAVAAAALLAFVGWERRVERAGRQPVVSAALVRTRSFTFGGAVGTAYFAGFTGIFLVVTLYLQTGLGLAPWQAGLVQTPFALLGALTAALSGRLLERFGRWTVVAGITVMAVGIAGVDLTVVRADGGHAVALMTAWLALAGLGNGTVISPNQALTLADVPVAQGGTAGGVLQTTQRIGAAVGIAVIASAFFATLAATGGSGPAHGYGPALSVGLRVTLALVGVALLVALLDAVRRSRGGRQRSPAGPSA